MKRIVYMLTDRDGFICTYDWTIQEALSRKSEVLSRPSEFSRDSEPCHLYGFEVFSAEKSAYKAWIELFDEKLCCPEAVVDIVLYE